MQNHEDRNSHASKKMSTVGIINAHHEIHKENLKDWEQYTVTFDSSGEFLEEILDLISGDDEVLAHTISKCLSFYRYCKEIEDKGGQLRFKMDGQTYKMKLP